MTEINSFKLNGETVKLETDSERILLWVLRTDLGLTGTKYGCGEGHCGACTVIVDGEALRSCLLSLKDVEGKEVLTIEGLADGNKLHSIQEAFMEEDALQCGYCTPGMIMNAYGLLLKKPNASREEIIQGMNDNFCRCGAHPRIISALVTAGKEMKGGK